MSKTTLCDNISINETYPKYISIDATYNCGTVMAIIDSTFTEQMAYELPSIILKIYVEDNGNNVLFTSRALNLSIGANQSIANVIRDIPSSCYISIEPRFDKYAVEAHNSDIFINESEKWTATETFPVKLIWDNSNICAGGSSSSGGGGGGSSVTPEQINFWNNKVTAIEDPSNAENVILTKENI
jgi:hypothetical protein